MKKLAVLSTTAILLFSGVVFIGSAHSAKDQIVQVAAMTKIPQLVLPGVGEEQPKIKSLKLNVDNSTIPKQAKVIKHIKKNLHADDIKGDVQKLGIGADIQEKGGFLIADDGNKYLEIEKSTGKALYMNKAHIDQKDVDGRAKQLLSDSDATKVATDFLKKMNWLPANFKAVAVTERKITPGNQNPETDLGIVVSKEVHFYQYIDNQPVAGVSRIVVDVGDKGEVEVARKYFKDNQAIVTGDPNSASHNSNLNSYPLKSLDQAVADLVGGKGLYDISEDGTDHQITDVQIAYWEDAGDVDDQPYLQPVYVMKGSYLKDGKKKQFTGYVPAISDEVLTSGNSGI